MSNDTVGAAALPLPDESPSEERIAARDAFDRAYARWHHAVAELNDPGQPEDEES